jgi:hypothetical protein
MPTKKKTIKKWGQSQTPKKKKKKKKKVKMRGVCV